MPYSAKGSEPGAGYLNRPFEHFDRPFKTRVRGLFRYQKGIFEESQVPHCRRTVFRTFDSNIRLEADQLPLGRF